MEDKKWASTYHHDFSVTTTTDDPYEIKIIDTDPWASSFFHILIFSVKLILYQTLASWTRTWTLRWEKINKDKLMPMTYM